LDEADTVKLLKVFGTCKTKLAMFFSSSLQDILFSCGFIYSQKIKNVNHVVISYYHITSMAHHFQRPRFIFYKRVKDFPEKN